MSDQSGQQPTESQKPNEAGVNKKQAMVFAIALAVGAGCVVAGLQLKPPTPAVPVEMGKVVYVTAEVKEGQTIPSDALEETEIEVSKIAPDALSSAALAAGRVCKYGLEKGQMVRQGDLAPQD